MPGCKIPEKTGSKGHSLPSKSASESDDHGENDLHVPPYVGINTTTLMDYPKTKSWNV